MTETCVNPAHFQISDDGEITPQPWMQWRRVGKAVAPPASMDLPSGGGGAKNDMIHFARTEYTNDTPVTQYVYGRATQGGLAVDLQARSKAAISMRHGFNIWRRVLADFEGGTPDPFVPEVNIPRFVVETLGGSRVLRIASGSGTAHANMAVPVTPGQTVVVSFRARRDFDYDGTASNSKVRVGDLSGTNSQVASVDYAAASLSTPDQWYTRTVTYTVAPGVTLLQIGLRNDASNGNVYLDDILITVNARTDAQIPMTEVSKFGGGVDIGQGGMLSIGTGYGIHGHRAPSHSIHFMPHLTGWFPLLPGETFTARAEAWFVSSFWENTMIDGGDQGTESFYWHGGTTLELFTVPGVDPPVVRDTPTVVASSRRISTSSSIVTDKPTGTVQGDMMLAIHANASGSHSQLTAPADWLLLDDYDGGANNVHVKVWQKVAGASEPTTYTFGHSGAFLSEGMAQIVTLRNVDVDEGVDIHLQFTRSTLQGKRDTPIPSLVSYKKTMVAFSFVNQLVGQLWQEPPPGMTQLTNDQGDFSALAMAYQLNPPNPTGLRSFKANRPVFLGDGRVSGTIVVTGPIIPPA